MKTHRKLWPQLVDWTNLRVAYRKCRRRKRYRPLAADFDFDWEAQLLQLQHELVTGVYHPGEYRTFQIHEPKIRTISAAPFRDRVVHHALINILEPIFERRFVYDSYACRRGKGTHLAIRRAQHYLGRHGYFLKCDVKKFFPNVDHEVLGSVIGRYVRDPQILDLIYRILDSGKDILTAERSRRIFPGDDLFSISRPAGLPIGNLTSQFFANVLMDQLDHFVKEDLRVPGFVRYSDDFVLFADSRSELAEHRQQVDQFLMQLRLELHPRKTFIAPKKIGLRFLGFELTDQTRRLTQDGLRRWNRKLRKLRWQFKHGELDCREIAQSIEAWKAHADFANSSQIQRAILKRFRLKRGGTHPDKRNQDPCS